MTAETITRAEVTAASLLGWAAELRRLSPAPAEAPTTPTVEASGRCLRCNGSGIGQETMLCIRCGGSGEDPRSLSAQQTAQPAEPVQTDDGWIEWKGGDSPLPSDARVDLRFRDGSERRTALSATYRWQHVGKPDDIIAYRIVQPAEASAPVAPKDVPGTAAGWMETARHYAEGSEYYQSLLDQIGQMFGSAAYTSDDGSVQDSILRAKVPELVAARISALEAENAKLREALEPLAKIGGEIDQYLPHLHDEDGTSVAIGDLRRARALLRGGADAE